jgi:hypothetical protein
LRSSPRKLQTLGVRPRCPLPLQRNMPASSHMGPIPKVLIARRKVAQSERSFHRLLLRPRVITVRVIVLKRLGSRAASKFPIRPKNLWSKPACFQRMHAGGNGPRRHFRTDMDAAHSASLILYLTHPEYDTVSTDPSQLAGGVSLFKLHHCTYGDISPNMEKPPPGSDRARAAPPAWSFMDVEKLYRLFICGAGQPIICAFRFNFYNDAP